MTQEELLLWCAKNSVVPHTLFPHEIEKMKVDDAGCGCCAVSVDLTKEIAEAFQKYIPNCIPERSQKD